MALYSCDHDDFIVVYGDDRGKVDCPVCKKDDEINALEEEIETLSEDIANLKD